MALSRTRRFWIFHLYRFCRAVIILLYFTLRSLIISLLFFFFFFLLASSILSATHLYAIPSQLQSYILYCFCPKPTVCSILAYNEILTMFLFCTFYILFEIVTTKHISRLRDFYFVLFYSFICVGLLSVCRFSCHLHLTYMYL